MSESLLETVDLKGEYIEHVHLLRSHEQGWHGLNLVYEIEPAGEMPQLPLREHLLVICLGNVEINYWLNGKWQQKAYAVGDITLWPANDFLPKTRCDRHVPLLELFIDPLYLSQSIAEVTNLNQIILNPQIQIRDPLIEQIGLTLKTELETNGNNQLYAEAMINALSAHLLHKYASVKKEIKEYSGGLAPYKLKQILEYIDEHLEEELTINQLANHLSMSPYYFANMFKQSVGIPPHQYITQSRIAQAKCLLKQRHLSIVDIAHQVGFQNQSHFTKVFRKYTGVTPRVYQNAI